MPVGFVGLLQACAVICACTNDDPAACVGWFAAKVCGVTDEHMYVDVVGCVQHVLVTSVAPRMGDCVQHAGSESSAS